MKPGWADLQKREKKKRKKPSSPGQTNGKVRGGENRPFDVVPVNLIYQAYVHSHINVTWKQADAEDGDYKAHLLQDWVSSAWGSVTNNLSRPPPHFPRLNISQDLCDACGLVILKKTRENLQSWLNVPCF